MRDRPAKQVLYICLLVLAFAVAFVNPWHIEVAAIASLICVMFVMMYIHSDRKRERERRRGFPVIPTRRETNQRPPDASASV
jgi:predicted membrane protein